MSIPLEQVFLLRKYKFEASIPQQCNIWLFFYIIILNQSL